MTHQLFVKESVTQTHKELQEHYNNFRLFLTESLPLSQCYAQAALYYLDECYASSVSSMLIDETSFYVKELEFTITE